MQEKLFDICKSIQEAIREGGRELIEKIYKNKYMVTCDNCGEGQEFDTWTDALEYMFEEGWKKRLVDGEFKHYCPECQEG